MKVLVAHPSRWGPGKIHAISKHASPYTWCGRAPYGVERVGKWEEVTCKSCNYNLREARLEAKELTDSASRQGKA